MAKRMEACGICERQGGRLCVVSTVYAVFWLAYDDRLLKVLRWS